MLTPVAFGSRHVNLFCTNADAMCAVCTGHHEKGGNSACLRGQKQTKETKNHNTQHQTPNTKPNKPHPTKLRRVSRCTEKVKPVT